MKNDFWSPSGGVPLSVTLTVTELVLGPWDSAGDHVIGRPLRLARRPTESTRSRVDGGSGRRARIKAERKGVGWDVRIRGTGGERQRSAFIHRLVRDGSQHWR